MSLSKQLDKHGGYPKIGIFEFEPISQFINMVIPKKTIWIQNG